MSDEPVAWPDDDADPFGDDSKEEKAPIDKQESESLENSEEVISEEEVDALDDDHVPEQWTLPVRVSPILALSGEEVMEYPLNESPDGRKNTSLIVSDNLIRIIQATYDDDGQRRLNVKTVLKNELTGFSHNHNELMHKHQWLWISSFFFGLVTVFIPYLGFLGQILMAVGLIGWTYMHLELHSLEFSTSGSKHKVLFSGYGSNRPMFRASMALIGPTIAKYMDSGEFDTESINTFHESLVKQSEPVQTQIPEIVMMEEPVQPQVLEPVQQLETKSPPPPPKNTPQPIPTQVEQIQTLPPPAPPETAKQSGPPVTLPPPPPPAPATPLPPPPSPSLPPATLPPPLPPGDLLPPPMPMNMDLGEVPLDAPLPNAPEIQVPAAPVEESLSDDEKNELLEELK